MDLWDMPITWVSKIGAVKDVWHRNKALGLQKSDAWQLVILPDPLLRLVSKTTNMIWILQSSVWRTMKFENYYS